MITALLLATVLTQTVDGGVDGGLVPSTSSAASDGGAAIDRATVKQTFEGAKAAFLAGEYERAAEGFLLAYEQSGMVAFRFNRAQALRLLGDCQEALDEYQAFVAASSNAVDVATARARMVEMRRCVERERDLATVAAPPLALAATPAARPTAWPWVGASAAIVGVGVAVGGVIALLNSNATARALTDAYARPTVYGPMHAALELQLANERTLGLGLTLGGLGLSFSGGLVALLTSTLATGAQK